jgi:hemerythrin superfamily protein
MPSQGKQDAIKLLTQDHREVEQLFEQFEKASKDEKKEQIARKICTELKVHAMIEEEIFYPRSGARSTMTISTKRWWSMTARRC